MTAPSGTATIRRPTATSVPPNERLHGQRNLRTAKTSR